MFSKKFLIIHLSRLGDMIQSLPAVKLLKKAEPNSQLTYLGIGEFCRLLSGSPDIDRLVEVPLDDLHILTAELSTSTIAELDIFISRIPELNEYYDLVINFTHSPTSGYIAHQVKAGEKSGRIFSQFNEFSASGNWGKFLFAMARHRKETLINLVDLYIGMTGKRNYPVRDYLPTSTSVATRYCTMMQDMGLSEADTLIGFQLGASSADRMWPLANFVRLGATLTASMGARIVLCGSTKEKYLAHTFKDMADYPVLDMTGEVPLTDLPSFFKTIDMLISNDTGPMHIAAAVGTKIVAIFLSVAFYGFTGPYGADHVIVQTNYPCAPCLDPLSCRYEAPCRNTVTVQTLVEAIKLAIDPSHEIVCEDAGSEIFRTFFKENGTLGYRLITSGPGGNETITQNNSYNQAIVGQMLWDEWLGLPRGGKNLSPSTTKMDDELLCSYLASCDNYRRLYGIGVDLCRKIIREFRNDRPDNRIIHNNIQALQHLESRFRTFSGPLSILKEFHEPFFAEIPICNFPELAGHISRCYQNLDGKLETFEKILRSSR